MPKRIEQIVDEHDHLVEFISACTEGKTLVRWFTNPDTLYDQMLLPADSAEWVKTGLIGFGYHITQRKEVHDELSKENTAPT
jgi:hypothetical protein